MDSRIRPHLWLLFSAALLSGTITFAQMGQQPGMQQPGGQGGMQRPGGQLGQNAQDEMPPAPQIPKVDDSTLTRQVHDELAKHTELKDVTASAKDGVVQLAGTVADKKDRKQAKKVVYSVRGVRDVKDKELTVNPTPVGGTASPGTAK